MTDLKRFEYVLALGECLNFSQASSKLGISQSTLSQYIQKIEKEIGVSLFDRTTTPLTITQYGEIYIKGARKILDSYSETLDGITDVDSGLGGSINIGISPTRAPFVLPPIVSEFKKKYPNVTLSFFENKSGDIIKNLSEGNIDFAYTALTSAEKYGDFKITPVCDEEIMLVCKKGSGSEKLQKDGNIDFSRLEREAFVSLQDDQMLSEMFCKLMSKNNIQPKTGVFVSELSTAIEMVKNGLGYMLLPSSYKSYGSLSNDLDFLSIGQSSVKRKIVIMNKKDKYINKPTKALMDAFVNKKQ